MPRNRHWGVRLVSDWVRVTRRRRADTKGKDSDQPLCPHPQYRTPMGPDDFCPHYEDPTKAAQHEFMVG